MRTISLIVVATLCAVACARDCATERTYMDCGVTLNTSLPISVYVSTDLWTCKKGSSPGPTLRCGGGCGLLDEKFHPKSAVCRFGAKSYSCVFDKNPWGMNYTIWYVPDEGARNIAANGSLFVEYKLFVPHTPGEVLWALFVYSSPVQYGYVNYIVLAFLMFVIMAIFAAPKK